MVVFHITLELFGDNLDPCLLLRELEGDYRVVDTINSEDIKNDKSEIYGFGSVSIEHPRKYGFSDLLIEYEEWFVVFIERNKSKFICFNVKDIWLNIDVYYVDQCSIELFNKSLLKRLTKYEVSLPMNIYKLDKSEIYTMLKDEGFDDTLLEELNYSQ